MAELLGAIAELLSIPFQIAGEILATLIAGLFRVAFSKPRVDEDGRPVSNENRPANRWQIFGYSLLGTAALSLLIGGVCLLVWHSLFAAQLGMGISVLLGVIAAFKAAVE